MRRAIVIGTALTVLLGAASAAEAGWVWRDGEWVYDASDLPLPPELQAPEPKPKPKPEPETPPPEKSPVRPATPADRAEPPAPPKPSELPDTEKPARPEEEPSWWERAKWWEKPPPPGRDAPLFETAKAHVQAGEHRRAEKTFKDLIEDYPESTFREEAMWLRAESLFARQRYYKAYEQYEDLIEQYAGSSRYRDALRKEIEIAELYLGPVRRRVLGIPLMSGEDEAIEILRRVYEHQPSGDLADDVVLRIADYYWSKRKWPDAEEYYDKYCKEYPNGDAVRHAELRRARCSLRQCEGPRYCTTSLRLARDRLRQFKEKYPDEAARQGVPALIKGLEDLQAQSLYEIAARYRRAGHPCAAAFYAERLRKRHPQSPWSEKAGRFLAPEFHAAAPPPEPAEADAAAEPADAARTAEAAEPAEPGDVPATSGPRQLARPTGAGSTTQEENQP
ncbi:MAG: outer membrane protein assembly factor BamD [Phycisphaerae bacterium]